MTKALIHRLDARRELAIASQNQLTEAVSAFSLYVDDSGKGSSSPKGFMIAMNKAVKKAYGASREDLEVEAQAHLSSVLVVVIQRILGGMRRRDDRASIRKDAIQIIKVGGDAYHVMRQSFNAYQ